ncbi:MAG: hypothetical protein KAT15_28835, partial [Bacteroidales bacterium]|nr:hypothetical protein [Bacteroidales bacterium]
MKRNIFIASMFFCLVALVAQTGSLQKPADYFGFEPGSDRHLFTYEQLIGYLQEVDKGSPRIKLEEIGTSPMGKPMYIAFISSEENITNLDAMKEVNRELALNATLEQDKLEEMVTG